MAQSSVVGETRRDNSFTSYVNASTISSKGDGSVVYPQNLPSSDELELLLSLPKNRNKVKKLVRTSDWPTKHEIRRSLWITLCSTIDSFTAASDGCSYHETVQEIFGSGMVLYYFSLQCVSKILMYCVHICMCKSKSDQISILFTLFSAPKYNYISWLQ